LSNTNAVHWQQIDVSGHFGHRFDRYFLSYESGLLKPDGASFSQVTTDYGCQPREILFFDDNPVNVDAARQAGIRSARVVGLGQLEAALIEAEII
jgi:putative hydrolase of the HAD superfamily